MSILLDTGILHAFLNTRDRHHGEAKQILCDGLDGLYGRIHTTTFVVDEAFTLLHARGQGKEVSNRLAALVGLGGPNDPPPCMDIIEVDRSDVRRAVSLFARHHDRRLSFTDCTTLAVMEERRIDRLASFDAGFEGLVEQVGLQVGTA